MINLDNVKSGLLYLKLTHAKLDEDIRIIHRNLQTRTDDVFKRPRV